MTAVPDEPPQDEPAAEVPRRHRPRLSFWQELPILVIVAVGLAVLIKAFLFQAFFIPSGVDGEDAARLPGLPG